MASLIRIVEGMCCVSSAFTAKLRWFFSNLYACQTSLKTVLLEKLLRCCPNIKLIYVVCRSKRNKTPRARIQELSELPLFEPLLKLYPDALKKVRAVEGDLTKDEMGMMQEARRELAANVEVVFHLGASLRLEADLQDAVEANILGTKRTMELAKEMKKIKAFVHVSTVFCQCEPAVVEEKIFPPDVSPSTIIALSEWLKKNKHQREIVDKLLGVHPNCYTFTKQLAESLVDEQRGVLPVVIVRPAIVVPTYKEPIPGWVDSLNGPIGILVAGGKGVLRSMMCGRDNKAQVVPCDVAINSLILSAWKTALDKTPEETPVYNASSGDFLPLTYGKILEKGMETFYDYPLNPGLWYPNGSITTNRFVHKTKVLLFQILPALLIDFLLLICGQKTFMIRVQNKIKVGCHVLEYFTMRTWEVSVKKITSLHNYVSKEEQEIFYLANIDVDVNDMMKWTCLGTKQYCMKEPLSSLPAARVTLRILWAVDKLCKIFIGYQFYKLFSYFFVELAKRDTQNIYASMYHTLGVSTMKYPFFLLLIIPLLMHSHLLKYYSAQC